MDSTSTGFDFRSFTSSDGYRHQYRQFEPPGGQPRGQVVCIHGIQSHGGWYEGSCSKFAAQGYRVTFLDRRGAGLNQEQRGDAPGFRRLLDDLAEHLIAMRNQASCPLHLVAISWGGKLAAALQRRHPGLCDGLVLVCPGFFPRVSPTFRQRMAILRSRLFAPTRLFPVPLSDPELFTNNPERIEWLQADLLSTRQATARFLLDSVRLDGYLRFSWKRIRLPVLLLLAGLDRIVHNQRTREFVERWPCPDRAIIEYPSANHTLEFEAPATTFVEDILFWLDARTPRRGMD